MLEIRAGTGGDEASYLGDLVRCAYAETQNWKVAGERI